MLKHFIAGIFCLIAASQAASQTGSINKNNFQEVQSVVQSIITDQIEAFGALDVDRAYRHASNSIKLMFPSSKIFGTMVKKSYPMIWNPKSFEFLRASQSSKGLIQRVMFTDQEGKMHFFDYALENNGETWVISGVYLVEGQKGV